MKHAIAIAVILVTSLFMSAMILIRLQGQIPSSSAVSLKDSLSGKLDFGAIFSAITDENIAHKHAEVVKYRSRLAGTQENLEVSRWVEQELRRSGLKVITQSFPVTVPVTKWCRITTADNALIPGVTIDPFWPNLVRTCTTLPEPDGVTGRVVDIGTGSMRELNGKDIAGNIALVSMPLNSSSQPWLDAAKLGAAALLFRPPDDPRGFMAKTLNFPADLPRFYVTGDADSLIGQLVKISARVDWEILEARNVIGVLEPDRPSNEALAIVSHTDSWSPVPDIAPGYQDGASVACMLGIAEALATQRQKLTRTAIFISVSGRYSGSAGIREFTDAIGIRTQKLSNNLRIKQRLTLARGHQDAVAAARDAIMGRNYWSLDSNSEGLLWRKHGQRARQALQMASTEVIGKYVSQLQYRSEQARIKWVEASRPSQGPLFEDMHQTSRQSHRAQTAATADLINLKQVFGDVLDDAGARKLIDDALTEAMESSRATIRYEEDKLRIAELFAPLTKAYYFFPIGISSTGPLGYYGDPVITQNLKATADAISELKAQWSHQTVRRPSLHREEFFRDAHQEQKTEIGPKLFSGFSSPGTAVIPDSDGSRSGEGVLFLAGHAPIFFNGLLSQDNYRTPYDNTVNITSVTAKTQLLAALAGQITSGGTKLLHAGSGAPGLRFWHSDCHGQVLTTGVSNTLLPNQPVQNALVVFGGKTRESMYIQKARGGYFRFPVIDAFDWAMVEAYTVDPETGRIMGAKDQGPSGVRFPTQFSDKDKFFQERENEATVILARLSPLDIYRTIGPHGTPQTIEVLDARFKVSPTEYSITEAWERGATIFTKPADLFYVILKNMPEQNGLPHKNPGLAGLYTEGFLLGHDPDYLEFPRGHDFWGPGYLSGRDRRLIYQEVDAAISAAACNRQRLDTQIATGVADQATVDLANRSDEQLRTAIESLKGQDYASAYRDLAASSAISARVYPAIRIAIFDAVGGILLYMFLIVPFSVFAERLLFGFSDIRSRLASTLVIFLLVFSLIRLTHPAYTLVTSPMIVLVGFIIFMLCLLIMGFVLGKFMERMRVWRQTFVSEVAVVTEASSLGATGAAFALGTNNMRKRKVRTTCTVLTLVLISFCLVCFTAPRPQLKTKQIAIGPSSYDGLVLRSESEIAAASLQYFDRGHLIPRVSMPSGVTAVYDRPDGSTRKAVVHGVLYLDEDERLVTGVDEALLPGGRWFDDRDKDVCYISRHTAAQLGIDSVDIGNQDIRILYQSKLLHVIGVFRGDDIDQIRDADRERLTPISVGEAGIRNQRMRQGNRFAEGARGATNISFDYVRGQDLIIRPWGATMATNFSSAVVLFGDMPFGMVQKFIDLVLDRTPTFARYAVDGLAYFGARLRSVGLEGYVDIIIPLLVGSFIVFNTMLGSVYERRSEIAIYSAVGLSPRYVFYLFLAESLVYAVIGVVGGYLLALGLQWISHLGGGFMGLDMNYSSRSAIYVTVILMVVVVLSSFVPAYQAARVASPSENIKWSLPSSGPGGHIHFELPFTYIGRDILAAVPFIASWFDAHGEDSSGEFASERSRVEITWSDSKPALTIATIVWLRPYDLGVSQEIRVSICPSPDPTIYMVRVDAQHLSGSEVSWRRTNDRFVRLLRQHLLSWRGLPPRSKDQLWQTGHGMLSKGAGSLLVS